MLPSHAKQKNVHVNDTILQHLRTEEIITDDDYDFLTPKTDPKHLCKRLTGKHDPTIWARVFYILETYGRPINKTVIKDIHTHVVVLKKDPAKSTCPVTSTAHFKNTMELHLYTNCIQH